MSAAWLEMKKVVITASVSSHLANPRTYRWMSIGLFLISLLCDGFYVDGGSPRAWSLGFGELIAGWYAALEGVYAWWANPLLLVAWITFRSRPPAVSSLCTVVALLAMGSFLSVHRIEVSEAGNSARIAGYGAGYWIWISSGLVLLAGNMLRVFAKSPNSAGSRLGT
jgi:hypothetical protein